MALDLYIGADNVYEMYGLRIEEQGFNEALQWAPFKPVPYNDWYEEDGIDPELSNPVLDSFTFKLRLNGTPTQQQIDDLIGCLNRQKEVQIDERSAQWSIPKAEFLNANISRRAGNLMRIELTFAENAPSYTDNDAPASNLPYSDDYKIDGTPFSAYGARILSGTLNSIDKLPQRKENFRYSAENVNGEISGTIDGCHYKDYDATLHCLMRADSLSELANNYKSLRCRFTSAGAHYIDVKATNKSYPCYYQTQRVKRYYSDGKIWLEFDIVVKIFSTPTTIAQ